jgi:hypothetical protein
MALGVLPLTILTIVAVPFVTYYISLFLFQRKTRGKIPPTIPYFFPGIFHAFSLVSIFYVVMLTIVEKNMLIWALSSSMLDHSPSSSFVTLSISQGS